MNYDQSLMKLYQPSFIPCRCDKTNAEEIVSEMLSYLETADYAIREEMVLKVAILAEKYAVDYTW